MVHRVARILAGVALLSAAALAALWLFAERGRLLRPSTRTWIQEWGGGRALLNPKFWEGYAYARWSNQYIGWAIRYLFPRLRPAPGNPRWATVYHGKVLRTADAKRLISVEQPIRRELEQVVPYPLAREIVLSGPPEIVAYECPCRSARENPCQPTQVCLVVGQPFVDFVLEHNPHSSRRLTRQEALDLLQAEHERGHLHAAYFKDVMLDRFYAICNCCACCCGGIESMARLGVPMLVSSGYVARVNAEACLACGTCAEACPFGAIQVGNWAAQVNGDLCMGCGVCEGQCPEGAIALALDASKPPPLDVQRLM